MILGPFIRYLYSFVSNFRCFEVCLVFCRLENDYADELVDFGDLWKARSRMRLKSRKRRRKRVLEGLTAVTIVTGVTGLV